MELFVSSAQQHKVGNCLLWRGTAADEDGPPWSHVAKAGCAVTTSTANVLSNRNKFHRPGIVRSILYIISLNQNSHFMHARTTLLIIGMSAAVAATAQCPFTPTILPSDLILCPNESGTLTTQVYDAYQWNKDGSPISGATGQTLTVDQWADAGSSFTVSATLDGCTEMSAPVLVDGWVFLLPYVIHGGDEPIGTGANGESLFCEGDTMTLTLSPGYTENIQWTNNGVAIPAPEGTSPVLTVTTSGSYTVSAAPSVCPNSIMGIGVEVVATFTPPMQPDIVANGDQICVYPAGNSTQWYLAGAPAGNTDCITVTSAGPYTAFVDYGNNCQVLSEPYFTTGIRSLPTDAPSVSPIPASSTVTIHWSATGDPQGTWMLLDLTSRMISSGMVPQSGRTAVDVSKLAEGNYVLRSVESSWPPIRIVVSH